jgi:septal ring factor EnvC (AmiA/AmiB activator)
VDPDRTVLRPAPSWSAPSKTPQYAPPRFSVVASTLSETELVQRTASVQEVQELRRELRLKELELGKLEAGALSAWDRTVPHLEAQIIDLQEENAALRRTIREAEEHSDADAQTVERLRASIAERDARLAEIRAQS